MSAHSRRRGRVLALAIAGVIAAVAGPAAAAVAPPFAELLRLATERSPQIAAAEADVGRLKGLSDQAAARPNPTATLSVENFAGSRPFGAMSGADTTLALAQMVELGGKRRTRVAAARAEIAAAEARLTQARADFARNLALTYVEAEAATARQALAREALALAREDVRAVEALVEAGREAEVRRLQVRSAAAVAEAELEAAGVEREAAFLRLSTLAGATEPLTEIAAGVLDRAPERPAAADASDTPVVRAARAERDAALDRVAAERARAAPDLTASLGVRRNGLEDASSLVAQVSAPLPLFDRNRGNIAAARSSVQVADARLEALRREAQADISTARVQFEAAQVRLAAAAAAETDAREASRLSRLGYEGGKLPLSELTTARRTEAQARGRLLDARIARTRALIELARLQGRNPFEDDR